MLRAGSTGGPGTWTRCWPRICAAGCGLFEGAELAGERLRVLPVLFHLMWRQELTADLTVPLGALSVLHAGGSR
jgi:hypothetical protein